ncbi:SDR family NAD(P)-dependent oxidoreductase [Agrococcus terreus]|uniref:Dehydrogenase n=1 Tax=Agrococcus terreus TaxID=574649 RepID=A0ABQ2KHI4_9MICO|nr:SDR family oxidoreductase [Agrococcus terreus]GGN83364.1 dehydrogenase [Agrococcus terreus]
MDLQLADRVILVVGGTGLIGRAVADLARAEGATVVTAARGDGADVRLDGADPTSVDAAVAGVLADHGRIDGLVVAAAPPAQTLDPARSSDPEQVAQAFEAKAMTFLRVANAVVPTMREAGSGRIVGVSGQNARLSSSITAATRNAGLTIAAQALADELAGTGVAVNVVDPGPVVEAPAQEVAVGKPGESSPEQVARAVLFLLSPANAISSQSIAVGHRVRGVVTL